MGIAHWPHFPTEPVDAGSVARSLASMCGSPAHCCASRQSVDVSWCAHPVQPPHTAGSIRGGPLTMEGGQNIRLFPRWWRQWEGIRLSRQHATPTDRDRAAGNVRRQRDNSQTYMRRERRIWRVALSGSWRDCPDDDTRNIHTHTHTHTQKISVDLRLSPPLVNSSFGHSDQCPRQLHLSAFLSIFLRRFSLAAISAPSRHTGSSSSQNESLPFAYNVAVSLGGGQSGVYRFE